MSRKRAICTRRYTSPLDSEYVSQLYYNHTCRERVADESPDLLYYRRPVAKNRQPQNWLNWVQTREHCGTPRVLSAFSQTFSCIETPLSEKKSFQTAVRFHLITTEGEIVCRTPFTSETDYDDPPNTRKLSMCTTNLWIYKERYDVDYELLGPLANQFL